MIIATQYKTVTRACFVMVEAGFVRAMALNVIVI